MWMQCLVSVALLLYRYIVCRERGREGKRERSHFKVELLGTRHSSSFQYCLVETAAIVTVTDLLTLVATLNCWIQTSLHPNSSKLPCPILRKTLTCCPFCDHGYQKLGKHLKYCPKRNQRDYSIYLSQTPKKIPNKSMPCPTCGKNFKLDTHLRTSVTCKQQVDSSTAPIQLQLNPTQIY